MELVAHGAGRARVGLVTICLSSLVAIPLGVDHRLLPPTQAGPNSTRPEGTDRHGA